MHLMNILRMVTAYPLNADIDPERSRKIKDAIDADSHPLATLRHVPLLSSLATCDGTPSMLSARTLAIKRPLDDDGKDDSDATKIPCVHSRTGPDERQKSIPSTVKKIPALLSS